MGSRDQNWGFGVKMEDFPSGKRVGLGFKNMRFPKTRFSQGKGVGLGLFSIVMIYKSVLDGNHEL